MIRFASLLIVFSLLASAATANEGTPPGLTPPKPTVVGSSGFKAGCVSEIRNYDKGSQLSQGIPGRARLVIPHDGKQEGYRELLCLPNTLDPHGPKPQ